MDRLLKLRFITTDELPEGVREMCALDTDRDLYMVVINETISPEEQEEAFLHEMKHIWHGDLDRPGAANIQDLELERHRSN